jgi:DNA repair protein RecO
LGRTYKATGINLKGMALGETDKLLTILTREHGLVRAVAAGARKHKSSLAGRSGLFVVNNLAIAAGRNLDRITQAETVHSFIGLSQNLAKLTAAQYLIELTLIQALVAQPQEELFLVIVEHLLRLNNAAADLTTVMALMNHGIYHLLAVAGLAPQVHRCCISRLTVQPEVMATSTTNIINSARNVHDAVKQNYASDHAEHTDHADRSSYLDPPVSKSAPLNHQTKSASPKIGFSIANGGIVILNPPEPVLIKSMHNQISSNGTTISSDRHQAINNTQNEEFNSEEFSDRANYQRSSGAINHSSKIKKINRDISDTKVSHHLSNAELEALQLLPQAELTEPISHLDISVWLSIERILRAYTKYHFDKPIQSADLIDSCFNTL